MTPRTAGALRYRWCQPLPDASQLLVQADGPMWAETIATAGMIEVLFPARASGSYRLSATTILGSPLVAVRDTFATVVAGGETVVSVAPCLPVP